VRIGFDVTSLRVSRGGIYWYELNLLRALLETDLNNEYLLLDYLPVHSDRSMPSEITRLLRPGVWLVRCGGMYYRQLARWRLVQRLGMRGIAALVDGTLLWPWAAAARSSMRRALDGALGPLDIFHASAAVQWRPPGGRNALTIYDMATRVLPQSHSAAERALQDARHRFALRGADVLIAISERTKRDVVAYLGIDPARIYVVPGGVGPEYRPLTDRSALRSVLQPYGLAPDGYLLHVGTIEARKNLPRLVEAYGQARHFLKPPVPGLVLAGPPGYRARDVRRRVEELQLSDAVLFLGEVPSEALPALYNGALALAYPSLYEGFGLPLLEAMACGTPVIASNVSAIPEVVGQAGMLVDPYDVGAIGRAVRSLLGDAKKRESYRRAGLQRAAAFTWEAAASRLLDAYRGVPR
jgi:glycosyltransferase involved in cell wall biosynthesis